MTLGEILLSGAVLQSIGIVGLPYVSPKAAPAEPAQAPPVPQAKVPAEERREKLRQEHSVRLIDVKDEGTGVARVARGIYGFTFAPAGEAPLFMKKAYLSFEVHKAQDGATYLIGYVSKQELAAIQGGKKVDVRFYPEPFSDATELVSLASEKVRSRAQPGREDGNVLLLTVNV